MELGIKIKLGKDPDIELGLYLKLRTEKDPSLELRLCSDLATDVGTEIVLRTVKEMKMMGPFPQRILEGTGTAGCVVSYFTSMFLSFKSSKVPITVAYRFLQEQEHLCSIVSRAFGSRMS